MVATQPEALVSLIVQKAAKGTNAEQLVARLGGQVTRSFTIIKAFEAQLPAKALSTLAQADGVRRVSYNAPTVTDAVALLLQDEPTLTPDQVKYRLMATANKSWPGYDAVKAGAGDLDVYAAVNGTTTQTANTGIVASQLLSTGSELVVWDSVGWNSVGWNSVGWNSVGWNSVGWNSVGWNSVGWNSDYWGP